jgi:hypothetical protein
VAEASGRQFTEAVYAAIHSVRHLYREVDRLNWLLRDELQREPDALRSLGGTGFGKRKDDEHRVIRDWYGRLYSPNGAEEPDEGDEEEVGLDEEGDESAEDDHPRKGRGLVRIQSDQALVAVKVILYDPSNRGPVEPVLQYAVLADWVCGSGVRGSAKAATFEIQKSGLRRVLRALPASPPSDRWVFSKAKVRKTKGAKAERDRRLGFRCRGLAKIVPLYELDSAEAIEKLAETIKAHWKATMGKSRR